jgi:hypothetical protein
VKCWVFLERASEYKFLKGLMHKLGDKHSVQVAICDAEGTNEIPFPVKVLGRGLKAHLFFRTLKCDLLLTTVPGLGRSFFKTSQWLGVRYVYATHSLISLAGNYQSGDFAKFDIFLSPSPQLSAEVRKLELKEQTKRKFILPLGYEPIANLKSQFQNPSSSLKPLKTILIAPSWKYALGSYSGCFELCRHLGSAGYSVILRPHELQWQKWTLKQKRELAMSGAEIVDNNRGFRGFEESQLMISDGSGVAFEYHLGCGKPVISVLNEQDQFSDFEHQVMRTMGCQILNNETCKIQDAIESLMTNHFQPDPNLIYDFDHNVEDVVHYLGGL